MGFRFGSVELPGRVVDQTISSRPVHSADGKTLLYTEFTHVFKVVDDVPAVPAVPLCPPVVPHVDEPNQNGTFIPGVTIPPGGIGVYGMKVVVHGTPAPKYPPFGVERHRPVTLDVMHKGLLVAKVEGRDELFAVTRRDWATGTAADRVIHDDIHSLLKEVDRQVPDADTSAVTILLTSAQACAFCRSQEYLDHCRQGVQTAGEWSLLAARGRWHFPIGPNLYGCKVKPVPDLNGISHWNPPQPGSASQYISAALTEAMKAVERATAQDPDDDPDDTPIVIQDPDPA